MVDGFSCILDFPKFSGGGHPDSLIKGIHQLNPQNLSSTTTAIGKKKKKKKKKKNEKKRAGESYPIQTIFKKFIFRLYRKEEGAGARSFLCDLFIGLFETLIYAIAEDNVCDNCIVIS